MRPNQQNSFSRSGYARQEPPRHHHYRQGMTHERNGYPIVTLAWLLRKLAVLIERLYILAKYQFYKRTAVAPSRVNGQLLKLGVVAVLAFFVFRKEASFSYGRDAADEQFSTGGEAQDVALRSNDEPKSSNWSLFSMFEEDDPFADDPADDQEVRRTKAYIRQYKDVAIEEQKQYGIPASIKMAQGIVESNAGASALSKKTNNHFGIKCFSRSCRKGHCSNFGDDSHKDFFRKYGSAWESWREHSRMIMGGKYKSLKKHGNDYKSWAHGLKKLGYATAKKYDYTLIERIEKYKLYKLDKM